MSEAPPKVFVSYSHDSEEHRNWVLTLSSRLMANGVDIILDQWDLTLGSDLQRFMEDGLTSAKRVLAVCTEPYVKKSNAGAGGGVAYEKMILTAQLMKATSEDRIIPIVRESGKPHPVPNFLSSRVYIDFRHPFEYESKYSELLHDIHGKTVKPRPLIGKNPFLSKPRNLSVTPVFGSERYVSPGTFGQVTFDFSNNNGRYVVGAGDMAFETAWSNAGSTAIYAYSDGATVESVALALGESDIAGIIDGSVYDSSSRVRMPKVGEIVIWKNHSGYFLATKIEEVESRTHGASCDLLVFSYRISLDKSGRIVN